MPAVYLPVFNLDACQATGWCVAVCPTECLDLWNDRPGLKFPQACVSCAACEVVCPTRAIELSAGEEGGEAND